ncbi:hypothetical protein [Amycolatopsis kentuckyensis]|uniref:hypothetical protein n=1 Tax=Amycolatopsis kentuckyensis TaxID=218823 RepID=UPI00356AE210
MTGAHDEPHTLPSAFAYSLMGGVGTWACSSFVLTNIEEIATWHVAAGGAGATVLAVVGVHHIFKKDRRTTAWFRGLAKAVAGAVTGGAAYWTTMAQATGHPNSLGSLGALAGGTLLTWYTTGLMTHWLDRRGDIHHTQLEAEFRAAEMSFWDLVLTNAGVVGAKAGAPTEDRLGNETVRITVPSGSLKVITAQGIEERIATEANALARGYNLARDAVKLYSHGQAGQFEMRIERTPATAVLAETIPYQFEPGPFDIADDFVIGRWENGEPIVINLLKLHVEIIAMTQAGKSSLLSLLLDRIAGSFNATAVVGGNWKVNDLMSQHLEPLRQGHQPTVSHVATNTTDTLEMLATYFEEGARRYAIPRHQRPARPTREMPAIFVVLDEASFQLRSNEKVLCHDGVYRTGSELIELLTRGTTAVFIQVILATQSGTVPDYGNFGGAIKRNIKLKIVMRIEDIAELPRVLPGCNLRDLKPEKLIYPGVAYIKLDTITPMAGKLTYLDTQLIPQLVVQRQATRVDIPEEAGMCLTVGQRWERPAAAEGEPQRDPVLVQESAWRRRWVGDVDQFLDYVYTGQRPAPVKTAAAAALATAGQRRPEAERPKTVEEALSQLGGVFQRHRAETREQGAKKVLGADEETIKGTFEELVAGFERPVPEPLATIVERFGKREFVSTEDLAQVVDMTAAELGLTLSRHPFSVVRDSKAVRRPEYEGKPTRGFFMAQLLAVAEEFRTGKRPRP